MTEEKREQMIARISDCWADSFSLKEMIRMLTEEFEEQLESWSDDAIEEEYTLIFGDYEQESQRH